MWPASLLQIIKKSLNYPQKKQNVFLKYTHAKYHILYCFSFQPAMHSASMLLTTHKKLIKQIFKLTFFKYSKTEIVHCISLQPAMLPARTASACSPGGDATRGTTVATGLTRSTAHTTPSPPYPPPPPHPNLNQALPRVEVRDCQYFITSFRSTAN